MVQAARKSLSFTEFVETKADGTNCELHNGVIVEVQPRGKHEEIIGFLATEFTLEFRRLNLAYFIPKQALVKVSDQNTCYSPDVLVLNRDNLVNESLWDKYSTVQTSATIPLVVEITSTNWRDDYLSKVRDYEEIGIAEYWIVDYLGLGGRRYIGNPKQPTISIYYLVDGEYQVTQFKQGDTIISPSFPDLKLTVEQVFN
ncbi:MAG: Uma2 family endonuclease [Cyanobacteria bacterium P01_F01_bin.143]